MADDLRLADFQQLRLSLGLRARARAARITDGDGALVVVGHRPEHVGEFFLVLGLHERDVRHVAQVADVEEAVMRRAVVAAQTGAVHAEADVQVLQRDVMDDHVIRALHERRVDRQKRLQSLHGQSACEQGRVFLGNTHVVELVWVPLLEPDQPGARGHGPGDSDDLGVAVGKVGELVAQHLRVRLQRGGGGFAGFELVLAQAVELVRLLERGRVAFALLGEDMQDDRLVLRLQELEGADQERRVVPVDGPVITQP